MGKNKDILNKIDELDERKGAVKEKNNVHERLFTIVIIVIIIGALAMLYFRYKGNYIVTNKENKSEDISSSYMDNVEHEENGEENNGETLDYEALRQQKIREFELQKGGLNITTETKDVNGKLLAVLKNSNEENVSNVKVQVIFYDEENKPVKIDESFVNVIEANMDYYMSFYNTPEIYSRYDFLITKDNYNFDYISYSKDVTYEVQEQDDGKVKIVGKNNSDTKIQEVDFFVLYYNENNEIISSKIVTASDVKKNKEFKIEFDNYLYNDQDYSVVPFAKYEIKPAAICSYSDAK